MQVKFGVTFLPEGLSDFVEWVQYAEASGFDIIGVADSQSLHRELYVAMTLCALNTSRVKFGSRVTNPRTRHPAVTASAMASLEELAPGRTLLGLGTGDSALAAVGLQGVSLPTLRTYVEAVRALCQGQVATYQDKSMRQTWGQSTIPIYIAAHGPKTRVAMPMQSRKMAARNDREATVLARAPIDRRPGCNDLVGRT